MRILVAEDDPATSRSLELTFLRASMTSTITRLGADAVTLAEFYDYDLIVLDLDLPDMSGHDVLRRLRHAKVQTPVLILSGNDAVESRLKSFALGADDDLAKPFQLGELLARVQAIVRRTRGCGQSTLQVGRLSLDLERKAAIVNGRKLPLSAKEYQVLELLTLRRGKLIRKEVFLDHLYGGLDEPVAKIVDVFVCKLRRKLAAALGQASDVRIGTVRGRGYLLHAPASRISAPPAAAAAGRRAIPGHPDAC